MRISLVDSEGVQCGLNVGFSAEILRLMSNTRKIKQLGFNIMKSLEDIIRDQINYYLNLEKQEERVLNYSRKGIVSQVSWIRK